MASYPRIRISQPIETGAYYYQNSIGAVINYGMTIGHYIKHDGVVITDWKKQLGSKGFISTNPLTVSRYHQRPVGQAPQKGTLAGRVTFNTGSFVSTPYTMGQAGVATGIGAADASLNSVANLATAEARKKLSEALIQTPVTAVEGRKTIALYKETVQRFTRVVKLLKHGNVIQAARELGTDVRFKPRKPGEIPQHNRPVWRWNPETQDFKFYPALSRKARSSAERKGLRIRGFDTPLDHREAVTNNWLMLQYGWFPHVSDLEGAVKALAAELVPKLPRRVVWGKGSTTETWVEYRTDYNALRAHGWFSVQHKVTCTRTREVKLRVLVEVRNPRLTSAQNLGLLDLGSALWEFQPWSFLVDYFTNIGDAIAGLFAFDNYNILDICENRKVTETYTFDVNNVWGTQATVSSWTKPAPFTSVLENFKRSRLTTLPSVYLMWNPDINIVRGLNMAALFKQQVSRFLR